MFATYNIVTHQFIHIRILYHWVICFQTVCMPLYSSVAFLFPIICLSTHSIYYVRTTTSLPVLLTCTMPFTSFCFTFVLFSITFHLNRDTLATRTIRLKSIYQPPLLSTPLHTITHTIRPPQLFTYPFYPLAQHILFYLCHAA